MWADSHCGKAKLTYRPKITTRAHCNSLPFSHFWITAKHLLHCFCCKHLCNIVGLNSKRYCFQAKRVNFTLLGHKYCAQDSSGFSSLGREGQGRCAVKVLHTHVHSMLTMFVIINIPDVHTTRPGPSIYKHFKDY